MKHRNWPVVRPVRLGLTRMTVPLCAVGDEAPSYIANERAWPRRMYAIAFDLDTDTLERTYGKASWRNAYEDIRRVLANHKLDRQQGSVYFGDADKVDPVRCVLAVQDLTRQFAWFAASVSDIRMLRIEENNDLRPAIEDMVAALNAGKVASPAVAE